MNARLQRLAARVEGGEAVVAGVLSGTSADGVDVVLARFDRGLVPRPLAFRTLPFEERLARRLRAVLDGEEPGLAGTALLHRDLGRAFGEAAARVAREEDVVLELVGSHGQTVWHHDGVEASGPASLQLGDGDFLAAAAGCPAVVDFRQADLAAGGEGAPLASIVDEVLFADLPRPWAVLNLGGMANLTLADLTLTDPKLADPNLADPNLAGKAGSAGAAPASLAFDVGPACSLLDGLARELLGRERDEDGAVSAGGSAPPPLVEEILAHPYFSRRPPKSTGRDTFGAPWVQSLLDRHRHLPAADLLAGAVEALARSVALALELAPGGGPCRELLVAGGGVHHLPLMERLEAHCGCPVRSTAAHGIDPDAREALLFALLAARWVLGLPSTQPWATGAAPGRVLGRLCPGEVRGGEV